MKKNASLVDLWMFSNLISGECAELIIQALQHNSALNKLVLPLYSEGIKQKIRLVADEVNKRRESRECLRLVKLKITLI